MDDWSYALLSTKVQLKGYDVGEIVYQKGMRSEHAYILLHGSVQETSTMMSSKVVTATAGACTAGAGNIPMDADDDSDVEVNRQLTWGTMVGEVALTNDAPYFNTVTAVGKFVRVTSLLALFESINLSIYLSIYLSIFLSNHFN